MNLLFGSEVGKRNFKIQCISFRINDDDEVKLSALQSSHLTRWNVSSRGKATCRIKGRRIVNQSNTHVFIFGSIRAISVLL